MISAQIKKGNSFLVDGLQDCLLQAVVLPESKNIKTLKLNYYNFIETITQIISEYGKSRTNIPFNLFIIDFFVRKYDRNSQLYRHFFGLTQSWKKFIDSQEDAKLFLSLLTEQRNNKQTVKRFQKIRKVILKTINAKVLQQIPVTHSDALTICHMIFEGERKNKVIKKINNLFISLKRKLVNTAKVNGAVACEFFMSAFEELAVQSYPQQKLVKMKQTNYELSFSEEYATQYDKKNEKFQAQSYEEDGDSCGQEHQRNPNNYKYDPAYEVSESDEQPEYGMVPSQRYMQSWNEFLKNNQMQKEKLLQNKVK